MKIVDRKTFLTLPKGTVYAKIPELWIVESLCVKYETVGMKDWYYLSFDWVDADDSVQAFDRLEEMNNTNASYPVQSSIARDGTYSDNDKFLIYEEADINFIVDQISGGFK